MNPSRACSGGWWARDCDPPTLGFRASCPRDAVLVLFKYALEKAAFPSQPPGLEPGWGRRGGGDICPLIHTQAGVKQDLVESDNLGPKSPKFRRT